MVKRYSNDLKSTEQCSSTDLSDQPKLPTFQSSENLRCGEYFLENEEDVEKSTKSPESHNARIRRSSETECDEGTFYSLGSQRIKVNGSSKSICKKKKSDLTTSCKGRKTKEQMKLLLSYFDLYNGKWDDELFRDLITKTGFNKKQLNKWFWDRKKKVNEAL